MSRIKTRIIGALFLALTALLTGCTTLRLVYNTGPQLTWWAVDGYFDFNREQAKAVKHAIDEWFDWHRTTQLNGYAALLASVRQPVMEPTTAAAVCRWEDRFREQAEPALQRAVAHFADIVPTLGDAQWRQLDKRHAKNNEELRKEFLQPDPAERLRAAIKRAVDRFEKIYGSLERDQLRVLMSSVAASPFNAEMLQAERRRRQQDAQQTLRRLVTERADKEQRVAALRALVQRAERSPEPEYRAYQVKLKEHNCAMTAQLHNATTAAQRQKARDNLKGWEDDLRALHIPPGGLPIN